MAIANLSAELMRDALKELDRAAYNHSQWAEALHATLISHMTPDERDIDEDAHRKCRFGQWYYGSSNAALHDHPGFAEIGTEHERMHRAAAGLLRSSVDGVPISTRDYEGFVTARKRLELEVSTVREEFEHALSSLDPLTGTPGRVGMLTELRRQHALAKRKLHSCLIAMMDLDHFKLVNDTYGHVVGDQVLTEIARHVATHLRAYDSVFRYGGEEFLICMPGTDLQTGHAIVDRLREGIASLVHEANGKPAFHVTVSFGIAVLAPDASVEQSIERADKALYSAKASGRNRAVIWESLAGVSPSKVEGSL
jgi:diguanylate cyclase